MKNLLNLFLLLTIVFIVGSCGKETPKKVLSEDLHINDIADELELFSRAFSKVIKNEAVVYYIKDAIYAKKKDENITLKDLFTYEYSPTPKPNGSARLVNIEQLLLSAINQYKTMSRDEMNELIDAYDLSLYWEYIQLWDGQTMPRIGYPTNEEEDVDNDYALMSYRIFQNETDYEGIEVVENYIYKNPVILIRPLEDFENGAEAYYSDRSYIWLSDIEEIIQSESKNVSSNSSMRTQNILDRFRLFAINTNGNKFDGSGGPEFRFFRNSIFNFSSGLYGFSTIVYVELTASAASTTNWIPIIATNNILHDLWGFLDWNQLVGTYEQDGGVGTKNVTGLVAEGVLNALGIPVLKIQLNATTKIQNRDDLIDKYEMYWTSFVHHVKDKNNWGWGFYNDNGVNLPIRATNHPDLKVVYKNY